MFTPAESKFEIYKDHAGKFRWRLKASNDEEIASGQGYESKEGCMKGVESVKHMASNAKILDFTARACPKCNVMIRADSNYCDHCGTRLDWQRPY